MQEQAGSAGHSSAQEAVNGAIYKEMRLALQEFESSAEQAAPPPRAKAFYSALRTVLTECVDEQEQHARAMRLAAAHQWFVKHRPRQKPTNPAMAAAMAASLSVQQPEQPVQALLQQQRQGQQMRAQSSARLSNAPLVTQRSSELRDAGRTCLSDTDSESSGSYSKPSGTAPSCQGQRQADMASARGHQQLGNDSGAASTSGRPEWNAVGRAHCSEQQASLGRQPALCDPTWAHKTVCTTSTSCAQQSASIGGAIGARSSATSTSGMQQGASNAGAVGVRTAASYSMAGSSMACAAEGPSARSSQAGSNAAARAGAACHPTTSSSSSAATQLDASKEAAARWREAARQQEGFERAVRAELALHAQHRARLEQEIMRRQEALRLTQPLTAAARRPRGRSGLGAVAGGSRAASSSCGPLVARCIARMDSQSQASRLSVYNGLQETLVQQLAHVDPIKAARRKLLAESATECSQVAQQLQLLGVDVEPGAVVHALLPPPEQPFLTCLARLPKPGTLLCATGEGHKKRRKRGAR